MRKELQSAKSLIAFRDVPEIDSLVLRKGISFWKEQNEKCRR